MAVPDRPTLSDLQRGIDQDHADDPSDPWHRLPGYYRPALPKAKPEPTGKRAQWAGKSWPVPPPVECPACHKLRVMCTCDPLHQ